MDEKGYIILYNERGETLEMTKNYQIPPDAFDYIIFADGDKIKAKNGRSGRTEFRGTTLNDVMNSVIEESKGNARIFIARDKYLLTDTITLKTAAEYGVDECRLEIISNGAVIDANSIEYPQHIIRLRPSEPDFAETIIVKGLNIDRTQASSHVAELFSIWNAKRVTVEDVHLKGNPSAGPDYYDTAIIGYNNIHVRVRNCSIEHMKYGIFIGGIDVTLEDNYTYYTPVVGVEGLSVDDNKTGADTLKSMFTACKATIKNNYVRESGYGDLAIGYCSDITTMQSHTAISDNYIENVETTIITGVQVALSGNNATLVLENNKIYGKFKAGYVAYAGITNAIVKKNFIKGEWYPKDFASSPFRITNYKNLELVDNHVEIDSLDTSEATPMAYFYLGGIGDGGSIVIDRNTVRSVGTLDYGFAVTYNPEPYPSINAKVGNFNDFEGIRYYLGTFSYINTLTIDTELHVGDFNSSLPPVKQIKAVSQITSIKKYKNFGTATLSGDDTTTQFAIEHGLVSAPKNVVVTPMSSDAAGDFYVTADDTYIYVNYKTAPPSGTDNIKLSWRAEV